jgi:hypothetical protein
MPEFPYAQVCRPLGVGTDLLIWVAVWAGHGAAPLEAAQRNPSSIPSEAPATNQSGSSPTQLEQYERRGHFEVIGGHSGLRYRIWHGYQTNVERLDRNGRRACSLCFMPQGHLPVGDIMLAQKIALELYENEAIRIANKMLPMDCFLDLELHRRNRW